MVEAIGYDKYADSVCGRERYVVEAHVARETSPGCYRWMRSEVLVDDVESPQTASQVAHIIARERGVRFIGRRFSGQRAMLVLMEGGDV